MRVVGSRSAPPASAGGGATMVAATGRGCPRKARRSAATRGPKLAVHPSRPTPVRQEERDPAEPHPIPEPPEDSTMARLGSRAGPAREQARGQVEPPVADPTRAQAPGARPTMALSTQVEEAANPPVPVGATPRSERIRRQAPAPRASPTSGPA